jgi:hypothetical protein
MARALQRNAYQKFINVSVALNVVGSLFIFSNSDCHKITNF